MANLIEACDWLLGPAPRRFGFWERRRLCAVRKPWWLRFRRDDLLHRQYADMPRLLREGFLTWGRIIHSNNALTDEGREDCPAEVLYSMLPLRQVDVAILDETGSRLFDLKGTEPQDPDTRALADHLTAEVTRRFGMRVPRELSGGMPCRCSSLMVFRRHLPLGILTGSIVPLLVPPEEPYCVMILPSQFWPEPFVEHWRRGLAVRRLAHWGM